MSRKPIAEVVEEFIDWRDEDSFVECEQIRPQHDDSMDRMDEDVGEMLHVEEV